MDRRRRTAAAGAVAVLAVLVAAVVVGLSAGQGGRSLNARAADVGAGLRCPTCNAVSVSDSNSPMAQSMREQIRRQLRAGRSPEQIRGWFADRYGDEVLLDPRPEGFGLVLWVVPAGALVVGIVAVVLVRRRTSTARDAQPHSTPTTAARLSLPRVGAAALVVVLVGASVPALLWNAGREPASASGDSGAGTRMSAADWVSVGQSLEQQEAYDAAAEAYRKALQRRPDSPALRTRLAFVLVRTGRADEAVPLVRGLADSRGRHRPEALLVLGLAQRAQSQPASTGTLRRFLRVAPDHPAAPQVRRLLREGG